MSLSKNLIFLLESMIYLPHTPGTTSSNSRLFLSMKRFWKALTTPLSGKLCLRRVTLAILSSTLPSKLYINMKAREISDMVIWLLLLSLLTTFRSIMKRRK
jgi:hypothetical protein